MEELSSMADERDAGLAISGSQELTPQHGVETQSIDNTHVFDEFAEKRRLCTLHRPRTNRDKQE